MNTENLTEELYEYYGKQKESMTSSAIPFFVFQILNGEMHIVILSDGLCRLFKDCYRMRPFEYLAKVRIGQAKIMLAQEKYTVNEIAQIVGYNDCSYFCSVFKKHEGISPAEFRALNCPDSK